MTLAPQSIIHAIRGLKHDAIARHRHSSEKLREMVRLVAKEIETVVRAGNSSGKTTAGAFLGVALSRGIDKCDARTVGEDLDGAPPATMDMPKIVVPNKGILIVGSNKQAEATLDAYFKMIGDTPHRIIRNSTGISEIRIKPDAVNSDDDERWSKILIFTRGGVLPRGLRVHWAHADETPEAKMWTEVRARMIRGLPYYRWITHTPDFPDLYHWLKEELKTDKDWQAEIVLHLRENQALTARDIKRLDETFSVDELYLARTAGEYVDMSGKNPWLQQGAQLGHWLSRARDPLSEENVEVYAEAYVDGGLKKVSSMGQLFVWEEPVRGADYVVTADPSIGVPDGEHDPCGAHVYRIVDGGKDKMVGRYNGFLGAYGLAWLCCTVAEEYNDALVDPDMTGGYGQAFLTGCNEYRSARYPDGYPHISRDRVEDRPGSKWKQPYGYIQTHGGKADMIERVRVALIKDSVDVPSAATVRCLMSAVIDANQRLIKPRGVHYEDFVCLGRFLQRHQLERVRPVEKWKGDSDRLEESLGFRKPRAATPQYPWTRNRA